MLRRNQSSTNGHENPKVAHRGGGPKRSTPAIAGIACAVLACMAGQAMGQSASLPVDPGETVHTFEARNNLGQVVVALVNTTDTGLTGAVPGSNFVAPIFWNTASGGNDWTRGRLGQVFGVTIDEAPSPNIYVTAASTTYIYATTEDPNTYGPLGPGGVYRLDGTTGAICDLATLPSDMPSGLGNVTYWRGANCLYVSNFSNGRIYRLRLGTNPDVPLCPALPLTAADEYDHGLNGRPAQGLTAIADDGLPGITKFGRRVWGLVVNPAERRLYYGVWWENSANVDPTESNEIWSVALDGSGAMLASTARREFAQPNLSVGFSNPAASLSFTPDGHMLIAERSVNGPHRSRLLEYRGGVSGAWVAQPVNKYKIGLNDTSCTGGGAADSAGRVWTTGDAITSNITTFDYGMMRIPAGGNSAASPTHSTSILIDSDQDIISGADKTQIGSLVHRPLKCTPPPSGLTSWFTFDESNEVNFANVLNPTPPFGVFNNLALVAPGAVGMGRCFNGVNQSGSIPSSAWNNVGAGNFTIDAWIKWSGGAGVQKIVDKRRPTTGYAFFVQPGGGAGRAQLFLNMSGPATGVFQNVFSGLSLPANQWVFVSVSVDRPSAAGQRATFCVGDPGAGTFQTSPPVVINPGVWGSLSNNEPLTIAVRSASEGGGGHFNGCLDEIEIFQRALSVTEMRNIFNSGSLGKCRVSCTLPPWTFFARGFTGGFPATRVADHTQATIRDYGFMGPQVNTYNFTPFAVTINGPAPITPTPAGSMLVPAPGVAALTSLVLGRPTNMTNVNQTGGYTMRVTNPVSGKCSCVGYVKSVPFYEWTNFSSTRWILGTAPATFGDIRFTNNDASGFNQEWRIVMYGPDGERDTRDVIINGLPPGGAVSGTFNVGPGQSYTFPPVTIQFRNAAPNVPYYLVIQSRQAGSSAEFEPLNYSEIKSLLEAPPCPADFNGDNTVDFFDYLDFVGAFDLQDPSADFNNDGAIDFFDYLDFVAALDAGC
jgi:hypothetical protein